MENGSLPVMVGGGNGWEGKERLSERKQTEWIFQGLCLHGCFSPLKTQQAECIDFNYIDLQFLIVVALSLESLGQIIGFPYSEVKMFLFLRGRV